MMTATPLRKTLQALLNEPAAQARARSEAYASERIPDPTRVALYGAGNIGQETLRRLRAIGVEPVAYLDDTPSKQGAYKDGLQIVAPSRAVSLFGGDLGVLVTIQNIKHSFRRTEARFRDEFGLRTLSFLGLPWRFPERIPSVHCMVPPESLLANASEILAFFDRLADDVSREEFVAQLRLRIFLDFDAIPKVRPSAYFPPDVDLKVGKDATFIDAGAYDGDSLAAFLEAVGGSFREAIVIEPDAQNVERLQAFVAGLEPSVRDRIVLRTCAVGGAPGVLRFRASGDMNAALDEGGDQEVAVVPLPDLVPERPGVYIKLDIEGAEPEALGASEKLIRAIRPTLAISAYHNPNDLWSLGLAVARQAEPYELFLRTHGVDGTDVVCYAVPQ